MYADIYDEVNYCLIPIISGHSPNIFVSPSRANIRTDIALPQMHNIKLWGQLKNSSGLPLYKVVVKLVELTCLEGKANYTFIDEILTDDSGFYFFNFEQNINCCYHILVCSRHPSDRKVLVPNFCKCPYANKGNSPCSRLLTKVLHPTHNTSTARPTTY